MIHTEDLSEGGEGVKVEVKEEVKEETQVEIEEETKVEPTPPTVSEETSQPTEKVENPEIPPE